MEETQSGCNSGLLMSRIQDKDDFAEKYDLEVTNDTFKGSLCQAERKIRLRLKVEKGTLLATFWVVLYHMLFSKFESIFKLPSSQISFLKEQRLCVAQFFIQEGHLKNEGMHGRISFNILSSNSIYKFSAEDTTPGPETHLRIIKIVKLFDEGKRRALLWYKVQSWSDARMIWTINFGNGEKNGEAEYSPADSFFRRQRIL